MCYCFTFITLFLTRSVRWFYTNHPIISWLSSILGNISIHQMVLTAVSWSHLLGCRNVIETCNFTLSIHSFFELMILFTLVSDVPPWTVHSLHLGAWQVLSCECQGRSRFRQQIKCTHLKQWQSQLSCLSLFTVLSNCHSMKSQNFLSYLAAASSVVVLTIVGSISEA